jgi:hypothetical protein
MRSFEIFVRDPQEVPESGAHAAPISTERRAKRARDVLDVFVRGANVTARVGEVHVGCVLRDLGFAVAGLAEVPEGKAFVRFYEEPWELCVERAGDEAALSIYRTGPAPEVGAYDVRVPFEEVRRGARDAIASARGASKGHLAVELAAAEGALEPAPISFPRSVREPQPVSVEIDQDAPVAFGADFGLRVRSQDLSTGAPVERADLHALLFRGRMRAVVRGRELDLGDGHPFLFAERLLALGARALDAWELGHALHLRTDVGGVNVGLRLGHADAGAGPLSLTLAPRRGAACTFPALSVSDLVEAVLGFGRALVRALLRRDRAQAQNLRLSDFRRELRELSERLREASRSGDVRNPRPEPYRAFAENVRAARAQETAEAPSRLRYVQRWRALVPGIDLRSTFLCGDRLVVGGAAETFGLDRATGEVLWRAETRKATSVPTPGGIARIHTDGAIDLHDLASGEVVLRTRVAPRRDGPQAGAVVHAPGLPRLLVVTEGERWVSAIDLASGEARWRFAWSGARGSGPGSVLRIRRGGRLLYLTSGDAQISAVDVQSGEMVWRARDRKRFRGSPTLDHEVLFAIAGGVAGETHLSAFDAFSGDRKWTAAVPGPGESCTVEAAPLVCGRVCVVVIRDRQGLRLVAFDRETGERAWDSAGVVAPVGTSWLCVGSVLVGNAPTGEVLGLSADSGATLWRHVLGRVLDADVPRRLEPVLRSGALFVPHVDVHVLRPSDGTHLASIGPCEAIPDLLRVDEQCSVYVAEESGHMACFAAGPRLVLVK